jgi:glycosyltransferase involved in cell wall biosynthesis
MEPELARADLVVVPLRYGSGTRFKILEAAAHRIPVVSTTLGAEGLGFEDGRHLLIADDAAGFASACVRLLEDTALRRRLADEAESAFLAHFEWSSLRARIRDVAVQVASAGAQ